MLSDTKSCCVCSTPDWRSGSTVLAVQRYGCCGSAGKRQGRRLTLILLSGGAGGGQRGKAGAQLQPLACRLALDQELQDPHGVSARARHRAPLQERVCCFLRMFWCSAFSAAVRWSPGLGGMVCRELWECLNTQLVACIEPPMRSTIAKMCSQAQDVTGRSGRLARRT